MMFETVRDYLLKEQANFCSSEKISTFSLVLGFVLDQCDANKDLLANSLFGRRMELIKERLDKALDFQGENLAEFIYVLPSYVDELDLDNQIEFSENVQKCVGIPVGLEKDAILIAEAMGMVVDSIYYSDDETTLEEVCSEKEPELDLFPAVHEFGLNILNSNAKATHFIKHREDYLAIEKKLQSMREVISRSIENGQENSSEHNPSKIRNDTYLELAPSFKKVEEPEWNDPTLYTRSKALVEFVKKYSSSHTLSITLEIAKKELYPLL